MGKHSQRTSHREARERRKDLRNRTKPPRRKGPTKKRWFVVFFLVGLLVGGTLGVFAKPIAKFGATLYLSIKQGQWQTEGKEKKKVAKSLNVVSGDPNKSVNTLIMGSDSGSNKGESGWCRSDVMMLVCLQERDKKALVISIPRDTRVQIAGHGTNKINAALAYGGPSGAIDMVKQFLGVDVNHYISMNFEGFMRIVDAIGGVPIHLNKPIHDPHSGDLPAGDLKLDGWQALVIVRSRKLPNGDLDRINSQQAFLKALMNKAYSEKSVWKAKQLVDILASTCKMDYSAGELLTLAEELRSFPLTNVQFVTVPGQARFVNGGSYYIADEPLIAQMAMQLKQNTEISQDMLAKIQAASTIDTGRVEQINAPDSDVITVLSGARTSIAAAPVVSEELRLAGHQKVLEGGQSKQAHTQTTMYYRRESKKACETIKTSIPEFADANMIMDDTVCSQYNSPVVVVLGPGFATPNLISIYGRIMKPAVNLDDLGKTRKSFS